ncbi:MAG: hypothetical protein Q4B96_01605 [Bacillota bacterium]|nr:hypothetical protein [Bacillota bacterium]
MSRLWPLLAAVLLCGGCAIQMAAGLYDGETQAYDSDDGYRLVLPASWAVSEDEDGISCSGNDGAVLLNVSSEFGGMEYYAPEELAELLLAQLPAEVFSAAENGARTGQLDDGSVLYVVEGTDSAGQPLTSCLRIVAPGFSLRYYLWVFCSAEYFDANQRLIEDILGSFELTADEQQLYQLMNEHTQQVIEEMYSSEESADTPAGEGSAEEIIAE